MYFDKKYAGNNADLGVRGNVSPKAWANRIDDRRETKNCNKVQP